VTLNKRDENQCQGCGQMHRGNTAWECPRCAVLWDALLTCETEVGMFIQRKKKNGFTGEHHYEWKFIDVIDAMTRAGSLMADVPPRKKEAQ